MTKATTPTQPSDDPAAEGRAHHLCPPWIGYLLMSPIRRLYEDPAAVLGPHVRSGMTILDVGCAMGYFSLPLARMVGPSGRVVCVDIQERMLKTLRKRARRRGLEAIIEPRASTPTSLTLDDLAGAVDFALAFHVAHETSHPDLFFVQCFAALRPGARFLVSEPVSCVSDEAWEETKGQARATGFTVVEETSTKKSWTMLLEKPSESVPAS